MDNLRILFLHSNPIGKLDYLKYLSSCPALEILTLYDSPISLRKNYRHHVVNAIATLKVEAFGCLLCRLLTIKRNLSNKLSLKGA